MKFSNIDNGPRNSYTHIHTQYYHKVTTCGELLGFADFCPLPVLFGFLNVNKPSVLCYVIVMWTRKLQQETDEEGWLKLLTYLNL